MAWFAGELEYWLAGSRDALVNGATFLLANGPESGRGGLGCFQPRMDAKAREFMLWISDRSRLSDYLRLTRAMVLLKWLASD